MRPSPAVVLAVLLVLAVAQLTRLLVPDRGGYVARLALAAAGLAGGEVIAATGHLAGLGVGSVHPALDLVLMAAVEVTGSLVLGAPPARGRR